MCVQLCVCVVYGLYGLVRTPIVWVTEWFKKKKKAAVVFLLWATSVVNIENKTDILEKLVFGKVWIAFKNLIFVTLKLSTKAQITKNKT